MNHILAGRQGQGHATVLDDLTNAELLDIALADAVDAVAGGHLIGAVDELAVRRVRRQVRRLVAGAVAVPAGGAA